LQGNRVFGTHTVIEYLVDYACMLAGGVRPFDEAAIQELVRRDVEHAYNIAAGSQRIRGATSLRRRAADASPGTHAIPGTKDASRDVARVVSDVSVLCPRRGVK
jgi:hypothetical protein